MYALLLWAYPTSASTLVESKNHYARLYHYVNTVPSLYVSYLNTPYITYGTMDLGTRVRIRALNVASTECIELV